MVFKAGDKLTTVLPGRDTNDPRKKAYRAQHPMSPAMSLIPIQAKHSIEVMKANGVLGQHIHAIKAGVVALSGGPILTAVDSLEIRIFGKSGHISRPDLCIQPVLTASHIVVPLQNLVTQEVRPETLPSSPARVFTAAQRQISSPTSST